MNRARWGPPFVAPLLALVLVHAIMLVLGERPARAQGMQAGDSRARAAEQKAMDDYLELHLGQASQGLESAIAHCGETTCSTRVRAHLHLSLGFVYGAGNKDFKGARAEFVKALKIDPTIELNPEMASRDLSRAFQDAKAETSGAAGPAPGAPPPDNAGARPVPGGSTSSLSLGEETSETPRRRVPRPEDRPNAAASSPFAHDSIALLAELDAAVLTPVDNVCSPGGPANWVCFDTDGSRYAGNPQPRLDNNNIKPGLALSTIRLVAAYDHLLSDRVSLGLRLGFAFNGGPTPPGGSAFLPIHVEARGTYNFDTEPARLIPFLFGSLGIEEVDTKVSVLIVEVPCGVGYSSGCARTVSAWRRAGYQFLGAGGGARYALGDHGAIVGDVRVSVTFSSSAAVFTPEIGYAYKF
jgi:hypothetical protein